MRIALFGGSFDPIHRGHLAVAAAAAGALELDRVLFAPAGRQPFKPEGLSAPFGDRMAMAALACEADARFAVSDLDAPRADGLPNYTVDTLATLRGEIPGATLFVLAGADSFLELRRWREPDRLLELAQWIVVSRPGFSLGELASLRLTAGQLSRVHLLETVHEDVSATELRRRMGRGDDCSDLLPTSVAEYIRVWELYMPPLPPVFGVKSHKRGLT